MRISVSLLLSEELASDRRGDAVVAIDVLRASTTIVTALQNGCAEILPVASLEDARMVAASRPDVLLCGERRGRRIDGFDLGNSPSEYTRQAVSGRALVLTTTNGTVLLDRYREFERMVGCFSNLLSIVPLLTASFCDSDVLLACAGKLGRPGLEDIACAGAIVSMVRRSCIETDLDDGALAAMAVWRYFNEDAFRVVSTSSHARYLCSIGLGPDVELCSRVGSGPIPHMPAGVVAICGSEGGVC